MNKEELIQGIAAIKEEMRALVETAETNKRSLSDEEKALFESKQANLNELKESLATVEAREQAEIEAENKRNLETKENKNKRNISMKKEFKQNIADAIVAIANNRSTEAFENVAGNTIELRATTLHDDDTEPLDVEERLPLLEPLQNALLVNKVGVKVINSANAVTLPSVNDVEATLAGEVTELTGQKLDFSKRQLDPKRVGLSLPFSNSAIKHADRDLVAYAMDLAGRATAQLINKWMFAPVAIDASAQGIFTEKLAGDASVAKKATWENIVDLEAQVKAANVNIDETAAYIMSPQTEAKLKSAPVALKGNNHTGKFIIEDNKINGYPYLVSGVVRDASANDYIGFGVFSNALIQNVGTLSLVVDNLSQSKKNITEVNFNGEYAVDVQRPEAFACFKVDASSFVA